MLTLDQIRAAQDNDLSGIRAVLDAMDDRITSLADKAAQSFGTNPQRRDDYRDDFRQDAVIALFEALPRFDGESVDRFFAHMYSSIDGALKAKAHDERNPGVDRWAMMTFKDMVARSDGDLHEAERRAQVEPPAGRRLSADRARAARLAWQGSVSLDATQGEDGQSIADFLVADAEENQEIRPKVGHGAALEALSVLRRYAGVSLRLGFAADFAAELPALVDTLEDVVRLPREASARRAVLDAMAILRSAVSTATDSEVAEDLRNAADDRADERAEKVGAVRAVLGAMGEGQRVVLEYTFGINGAHEFGQGDRGDDEGLAEVIGSNPKTVRDRREKGLKAFAKRWIKAFAKSPQHADALAVAAAANLARGGRK